MLSSRPYLTRGLYEWLLDNDQTPYVVVDAEQAGVKVPRQFIQNGQIVLNVGPTAVRDLAIENAAITFSASFGGHAMQVVVPMPALIAIYARETGVGMVFGHEPVMPVEDDAATHGGDATVEDESVEGKSAEEPSRPGLASVERDAPPSDGEASQPASPTRGRPALRVIK